jgi:hypothetical protein
MGRLIEVQDAQKCPSSLTLRTGDMLLFHASGGRVGSGGNIVEMLGPFLQAVLGDHGNILAPMGAPNVVFFRAHQPGRAIHGTRPKPRCWRSASSLKARR